MTTTVHVVVYDGFDELDAVGPYELLRNGERFGADLETTLVSREPRERVTAGHGLGVEPDGVLPDPGSEDAPDLLVVPGGGWSTGENRGVRREYEAGDLPAAIAAHHDAGTVVAAVCTGAMLLAKAGLVEGRPAVTHASALDDLREAGADVVDARVVDDGDVLTAGGVTSGLDLALHLVERYGSREAADRVAEVVEYERRYEVHGGG